MSGRQSNSSAKPPKLNFFKGLFSRFSQYIQSRATRASNKIKPSNSPPLPQLPASRLSRLRPLPIQYDLDSRIKRYKLIQETLKELNKNDPNKLTKYTCLKKNYANNTYYIKDIITLDKRIGSQSENGAIYKTVIEGNYINIATKVMESSVENKLETKLMKAITEKIILTKKSKHFVIMYCYSLCKELEIYNADYALANFNELAKNDLGYLLQQEEILKDEELLYNLLLQAFLSIGTFHNFTGYIHKDCKWTNFLYFDNTENNGGDMICYYQYIFDSKMYYLKSCKYNLMIYDLGLSYDIINCSDKDIIDNILSYYKMIEKELNKSDVFELKRNFNDYRLNELITLITNDYLRILPFFTNTSCNKLSKKFGNLPNDDISKFIITISDKIFGLKIITSNDKDIRHILFKNIFAAVLDICIEKFKEKGIFTDEYPKGSIIINNQPFELYSETKLAIALRDI
jgi:hypothetical protein